MVTGKVISTPLPFRLMERRLHSAWVDQGIHMPPSSRIASVRILPLVATCPPVVHWEQSSKRLAHAISPTTLLKRLFMRPTSQYCRDGTVIGEVSPMQQLSLTKLPTGP